MSGVYFHHMNAPISLEIEEVVKIPEAGTNRRLPASNRGAPEALFLDQDQGWRAGRPNVACKP